MPANGDCENTALPSRIGLVGVGTIGSAVVKGLCTPGSGRPDHVPKFIISPRGAAKAAELARAYPDYITIAKSNQEVVDNVDCVVLAVLPKQAEEVISNLRFRDQQQVISLIAGLGLSKLKELTSSNADCTCVIPLPAVARRMGASLLTPPRPFAEAIFNVLGGCVSVEDETQFKRMLCVTALMGDFYKRQHTIQRWLVDHGIPEAQSARWVGASFATFAADSVNASETTFEHLVEEQTPGGLNEMVWKEQEQDGSYLSLSYSLDTVHHRLLSGSADLSLAPASKRVKLT